MTKQEKAVVISEVTEKLKSRPNVYLVDTSGLTVESVNKLRALCFKASIEMRVVKNTLLRKAMEATGANYSEVFPVLEQHTAVFFVSENINGPAKLIKTFRKKADKPSLKGAWINEASFIGDNQLDVLANLKSKKEMIGDIIAALQSPAQNVISALQNAGGTIAGILKTLEEKKS
jgi:large subunit ribosomal protein L10